jgi:hypothetical protein
MFDRRRAIAQPGTQPIPARGLQEALHLSVQKTVLMHHLQDTHADTDIKAHVTLATTIATLA